MAVHNPPFVPTITAVDEIREEVIGSIDNVNKIFTASVDFETSTLKVFLNGQLIGLPDDYAITGTDEITLADAPKGNPGNSDKVTLIYIPA